MNENETWVGAALQIICEKPSDNLQKVGLGVEGDCFQNWIDVYKGQFSYFPAHEKVFSVADIAYYHDTAVEEVARVAF